jgi:hypothetical protein
VCLLLLHPNIRLSPYAAFEFGYMSNRAYEGHCHEESLLHNNCSVRSAISMKVEKTARTFSVFETLGLLMSSLVVPIEEQEDRTI